MPNVTSPRTTPSPRPAKQTEICKPALETSCATELQTKRSGEERATPKGPATKRHQIDRRSNDKATTESTAKEIQLVIIMDKSIIVVPDTTLAYKLGSILQHGTTYELIDFLASLHVAVACCMAQEHAEQQLIEKALDNEPASDDEPKLQKVGRKRATKKRRTRIELPELNTALVETYRELERTMCAAKDMAANCKLAWQQAKIATDMWKAPET